MTPTKQYGLECSLDGKAWAPAVYPMGVKAPVECDSLKDIQREAEWASRLSPHVRITFRQGAVA